jgi:hypothetical protein
MVLPFQTYSQPGIVHSKLEFARNANDDRERMTP